MSVVRNNGDHYIFMIITVIAILVFIVPLSFPLESAAAYSTVVAKLSNEEVVANLVTWDDFQSWMIDNPTMYWEFDELTRNCVWFTNDLTSNAKEDGMTIYPVTIYKEKGYDSHAINYGEFLNENGENSFGLIEPQTGEIWFSVSDYLQSDDGKGIISITVKKGVLEESAWPIKRLY